MYLFFTLAFKKIEMLPVSDGYNNLQYLLLFFGCHNKNNNNNNENKFYVKVYTNILCRKY